MHTLEWRHSGDPGLAVAGDLIERIRAGRIGRHAGFIALDESAFRVPGDDATGDAP